MTRTFLSLLVAVAAATALLASAPAMADEPDDPNYVEIDEHTYVEDWEHSDGQYSIVLAATNGPVEVSILPPLGSADDGGGLEPRTVFVPENDYRTVTVEASGDLHVFSEHFFETGEYATLDSDDPLIGGPWTATDAQHSAIGAGLAVTVGVIWKVLKKKTAMDYNPVRLK